MNLQPSQIKTVMQLHFQVFYLVYHTVFLRQKLFSSETHILHFTSNKSNKLKDVYALKSEQKDKIH